MIKTLVLLLFIVSSTLFLFILNKLIIKEIISQWPARQRWSVPYLDGKFPKQTVHVGIDSKGYGIGLPLHEYH